MMKITDSNSLAGRILRNLTGLNGYLVVLVSLAACPSIMAQDAAPPGISTRPINRINSDGSVTSEIPQPRIRSSADLPRTVRNVDGERTVPLTAERAPSRLGPTPPRPPSEVAPARFEATVFEVQISNESIHNINVPSLEAKAGTPQALNKALDEYGKAKVLYKIDQVVNLFGENITLGTQEPVIANSRANISGGVINSVTYQQVGLIISISANRIPKKSDDTDLCMQMNLELSAPFESSIEISPQMKATSTRNISLSHSEIPQYGKPLVLLNICVPGSEKESPVAYVVRYIFSKTRSN